MAFVFNPISGNLDITAEAPAADTVEGPASSTDNAISRFDGTTGTEIQNSNVTIDDSGNIVSPGELTLAGLAVKTTIDAQQIEIDAAQVDIVDLVTLSGVAVNSTDLGTFTGSIIPDNSDIKEALQSLESTVDEIPDPMSYRGLWDATTNTPTLTDGTGTNGYVYQVSVAGTQFTPAIVFAVGDKVVYNGTDAKYEKWDMTDAVISVNGLNGIVTLAYSNIGTVPVANGGTNSIAALNNNRMIISSGGAIVEQSAITAGSVLFADANGLPGQDNANLFFDNTNNRLGIGTASPGTMLHLNGDGQTMTVGTGANVATYTNYATRGQVGYDGALVYMKGISTKGVGIFSNGAVSPSLVAANTSTNIGLGGAITDQINLTGASMVVQGAGNVGIGAVSPTWKLSVQDGSTTVPSVVIGADTGAVTLTNSTNKVSAVGSPHYTAAEKPAAVFSASNTATNNILGIGGGHAGTNAATQLNLYTASNSGTPTGTARMTIGNNGEVSFGAVSGATGVVLNTARAVEGFQGYSVSSDSSNYERWRMYYLSNNLIIAHEALGTGSANRDVSILTRAGASGLTISGSANAGTYTWLGSASSYSQHSFGTSTGMMIRGNISTTTTGLLRVINAASTPFNASSGQQVGVLIDPAVNGSGTAGIDILRVNPTLTSGGSGQQNLLSLQVADVSKFRVSSIGDTIISSAATSGLTLYNTTDETTNYERTTMSWVANVFTIDSNIGGTGTQRNLSLLANGGSYSIISSGRHSYSSASTASFVSQLTGTRTGTGIQAGLSVTNTINQSGSATYDAISVNPTITAPGSGGVNLLRLQAGGVDKFRVDSNGSIYASSTAANGFKLFNTSDEVTNTEFLQAFWSSNLAVLQTNKTGSGASRSLQVSGVSSLTLASQSTLTALGATAAGSLNVTNTTAYSSTSAVQTGISLVGSVNQTSGTGGYDAILVNPTLTAVGSAGANLLHLQAGSVDKFRVDSTGKVIAAGAIAPGSYTTANKNALVTPTSGAIVYDTDKAAPSYYNGAVWQNLLPDSAGDIAETSFSYTNNQVAAANVTGLAFANASVRGFTATITVVTDATADTFEQFVIEGVQRAADWVIASRSVGDTSGIVFSITTAGQLQYTSDNKAGFVTGTIKFRASTIGI